MEIEPPTTAQAAGHGASSVSPSLRPTLKPSTSIVPSALTLAPAFEPPWPDVFSSARPTAVGFTLPLTQDLPAFDRFIFELAADPLNRLCLTRDADTPGSTVALGPCDFAGSVSRSTNDQAKFWYARDGYIRAVGSGGGGGQTFCVGPSAPSHLQRGEANYLELGECAGADARFVLTSRPHQRIQSVVDPNLCVVVISDGTGNLNIGDRAALYDCRYLDDGGLWRPDRWWSPKGMWPPCVIVHSASGLAWDDVVVSFIVGVVAFGEGISDYNVTIVRREREGDGEDDNLVSAPAAFSLPACGTAGCTAAYSSGHTLSGNVTFGIASGVPVDDAGEYVALVRAAGVVRASSAPFVLESPPPTASPAPTASSRPSGRPTGSRPPSDAPSLAPTYGTVACDDTTLMQAFAAPSSLAPGIIVALLALAPALCYLRQRGGNGKFLWGAAVDTAEKFYVVTTTIAALRECFFLPGDRTLDDDSYGLWVSTLVLGIFVLAEFAVGFLGYVCCAGGDGAERIPYDAGRYALAASFCDGWILTIFLMGAAGGATLFQVVGLYGVEGWPPSSKAEQAVTTIFLIVGLLPALLFGFLPKLFCCQPVWLGTDTNFSSTGIVLYKWWKWYKMVAGDVPNLIFSFVDGNYLAFSWLVELLADAIQLRLGIDVI